MKELLKDLGAFIRKLGFKGSGQNFRKVEDHFVFVINIQGSRTGDVFFVNLGAQPTFIPAECDAPLATLKEYECIMRTRVGKEWEWSLDDQARLALKCEIEVRQREFFGLARTLRAAVASDSVDELIRKFSAGTTRSRAALHLARTAAILGHSATADALVEYGLIIAGEPSLPTINESRNGRDHAHF